MDQNEKLEQGIRVQMNICLACRMGMHEMCRYGKEDCRCEKCEEDRNDEEN